MMYTLLMIFIGFVVGAIAQRIKSHLDRIPVMRIVTANLGGNPDLINKLSMEELENLEKTTIIELST